MFDRRFFSSKLGKAAIASVAAMTVFVALSTQMHVSQAKAATVTSLDGVPTLIEVA